MASLNMSRRTVRIKYERLEYVPKSIEVDEEDSDKVFDRLKKDEKRNWVRNLRRL